MAFALNQALFSGVQQRMPKHLAILHARENNIRIIMVLRNVIAFASFPEKYRSNFFLLKYTNLPTASMGKMLGLSTEFAALSA